MEMALSGTILPSISTFANQKEKCWEDVSCDVYIFILVLQCNVNLITLYYIDIFIFTVCDESLGALCAAFNFFLFVLNF